ncbi:MAG: hypothetical protein IPK83_17450 [Planctomycetes bacterium]|nr:hypothetical protein [Planctomycetota bacterium]
MKPANVLSIDSASDRSMYNSDVSGFLNCPTNCFSETQHDMEHGPAALISTAEFPSLVDA